jgi:hypothetical protein
VTNGEILECPGHENGVSKEEPHSQPMSGNQDASNSISAQRKFYPQWWFSVKQMIDHNHAVDLPTKKGPLIVVFP